MAVVFAVSLAGNMYFPKYDKRIHSCRRCLMSSFAFTPYVYKFSERVARVLVVDEDEHNLRILRLILEGQGYEVFTCPNHESGLRCLEAATFDFVVVSQGSEAFEGRVVLGHALRLNPSRPVLVITSYLDMPSYLEAMPMGAIDYLKKPVPPADLLRYVRGHKQWSEVSRNGCLG